MGQDYDKDLYIVLVGSGTTTLKNFVDNVEDYIFGPKDEREATLLIPYTKGLTGSMDRILKEWAVGNYPIHAFVEPDAGHASISRADKTKQCEENGTTITSGALEAAMSSLVEFQKAGNEVVVVVLYDEDDDVKLVGELKNYQSIPVLNLDGMIDSFPNFKTTDEILKEEREREEFETKEAIRLAAEKEQEKAAKAAAAPAKKAAAPRKRAAAKPPTEKPLTEKPAPRKRAAAPKPEPVEAKVVEETSELPKELEPVKPLTVSVEAPVPDLWADVSKAQASVSVPSDKLVVSKDSLAQLGEGIKEMSQAYAKTIDALTDMLKETK
ncbi:hypothetical protein SEA_LUCKYSOCKE_104 [Streptomyces phage LuckySocke]|jgi:hypothetical protein|nr:hypothetical protein SEA_ALONE_106 [Streptomyces phage Alone3]WPH58964.1 hypothetical protein SEA_LUCKYSOCKE_104 [Streptomyces phage LuckySocke]